MSMFADFGSRERVSYFNDHGQVLANSYANAVAALEELAATMKVCGAHERAFTPEDGVSRWLDTIHNDMPEEVVAYLRT